MSGKRASQLKVLSTPADLQPSLQLSKSELERYTISSIEEIYPKMQIAKAILAKPQLEEHDLERLRLLVGSQITLMEKGA